MSYLIKSYQTDIPSLEKIDGGLTMINSEDYAISTAAELLDLYLETDNSAPLMPLLIKLRDEIIEDLDQVGSVKEIYGLMYWLLGDKGIDNRGESLEETADRLGDIDIENDSDQYTDIIFHLKDAVERLYDLELESA
ncbi:MULTISPECIES: hypothetical protein [unclassified Neptuniibacter]|mgnify:FL=1|jgi:hypothetical protein|uniref:hypothetical protein n=1 Tax=unclassified Neptuniibacter TaxID=2630693 RepID=UPI0026E1D285|nr:MULTISPECIES: hypothetical protein [unclassified Neptuniibacter]MDO6513068.1 hypothetical protein [Neptuniibacter sp. 2_MG-2023]MDO6592520.1 hypothetical protein [Neptuniibacter sp. 1_MG-2023]